MRAEELLRRMYDFYEAEGGAADLKPDSRSFNVRIMENECCCWKFYSSFGLLLVVVESHSLQFLFLISSNLIFAKMCFHFYICVLFLGGHQCR